MEQNLDMKNIRIAVEGCGHGHLDDIYASVQKSCELKGWDGVDLVIIGGDFQAVRTRRDLNVTAMPAKYRKMGDFHQYYYGTKTAPYLTVFIGGNHEASNHLFELYYGGWVAPNIYYLGAANVLRLGSIKIASMSGIWAGYDYRRHHHERLPYNDDTMRSVYHQRELDVRKLLAYRNQVDIGLSHDWPHEIWRDGDYKFLFKYKSFFQSDARDGKLGSKAATQVLDRLRPAYWFSAHLHFKYAAYRNHEQSRNGGDVHHQSGLMSLEAYMESQRPSQDIGVNLAMEAENQQEHGADNVARASAVNAWSTFSHSVEEDDARIHNQAQAARAEELANNTGPSAANYTFQETFKPVSVAETGGALDRQERLPQDVLVPKIPQYDGTCLSMPKRRRHSSPSDEVQQPARARTTEQDNHATEPVKVSNPDAIDISLSDSDDDSSTKPILSQNSFPKSKDLVHSESTALPMSDQVQPLAINGYDADHDTTSGEVIREEVSLPTQSLQGNGMAPKPEDISRAEDANGVPEHLRAELEAMSTNFAPETRSETSPDLPFPKDITNKATRFLALSKPEKGRDNEFLQLLEIEPCTATEDPEPVQRPLKLQYDPEWLAILRTFSPELQVGGSPQDQVQAHRGDTYYRDQIVAEEDWIKENVVNKGLLQIPENFEITVHDDQEDAVNIKERDMPREQTNPQTAAFCQLIGIDNKLDFSEEERDARMAAGAPASKGRGQGHNRGRGGGNRGGNRGGGRGWGRGGRGRGRGRF